MWNKLEYSTQEGQYRAVEHLDERYVIAFESLKKVYYLNESNLGSLLQALGYFFDYPDRKVWTHDSVSLRALQGASEHWTIYVISTPGWSIEMRYDEVEALKVLFEGLLELEK